MIFQNFSEMFIFESVYSKSKLIDFWTLSISNIIEEAFQHPKLIFLNLLIIIVLDCNKFFEICQFGIFWVDFG